ncbi:hypothetical protein DACRYDRAFT_20856 [Dacryopinax primogenitus]|uniref:Uncharacterized protein n=1 Tax=Dacryopinax primogenitus (strain DJM 731) TaxID=1858805 RepID=M5G255_DACPD|nr:uncharacterized protein DACRYDRAFT_20856 [Dacryopinax primogenitus]EJU04276.1 hypothetical protein DACRYDRAFT_20856 [Dacryopinax primogenitus]
MGIGWLLFGGLSVLSMNAPRLGWDWRTVFGAAAGTSMGEAGLIEPLEQVRSAGMLFMFMVVLVVIAYFTNPNEASFRTFLTELTFRRHLTQLHIPLDDKSKSTSVTVYKGTGAGSAVSKSSDVGAEKGSANKSSLSSIGGKQQTGLLFTNRAAVTFRTGPHKLRSLGIFSIGIVQPVVNPPAPGEVISKPPSSKAGRLSSAINGTASTLADESATPVEELPGLWIIGTFGTWWIGGPLVPVPQRKGRGKEKCKEGKTSSAKILSIHKLNNVESAEGIPEADTPISVLKLPSRPSTPPPLPKSASLPLHAQETPIVKPHDSILSPARTALTQSPSSLDLSSPHATSLQITSSLPQLFSNEPAVVALLAEIKRAETAVSEVQSQIDQLRSQSTEQYDALNASVEQQRERKRQDEAEKKELKIKTRTLDESRRQAESVRKDAEKKLRGIQAARDGAAQKKHRLECEIEQLKEAVESHGERVKMLQRERERKEVEAKEELEQKSEEIKSKEVEVATLSARAQGLEEKFKQAEDRLKRVREEEQRRQARVKAEQVARAANAMFEQQMKDQRIKHHHAAHYNSPFRGGTPHVHTRPHVVHSHTAHAHHQASLFDRRQMAHQQHPHPPHLQHQAQNRNVSGPPAPHTPDGPISPTGQPGNRSRSLSLKGARAPLPGNGSAMPSATASAIAQRAKGYSIFDQDIAAAGTTTPPQQTFGFGFNPTIGDSNPHTRDRLAENLLSPAAASFLPSNLLVEHSPRLLSDESPYSSPAFEKGEFSGSQGSFEGRRLSQPNELTRSATEDWRAVGSGSRRGSHPEHPDEQFKKVLDQMMEQAASIAVAGLSSFDRYNDQRAAFSPRHDSAPHSPIILDNDAASLGAITGGDSKRRWFSSSKKPALNPDAKVFTPPASFMASTTSLPQMHSGNASFSSRFMPWRGSGQSGTLPASLFADLPVSSTDGPSFFSSLRAFQPSADELRALGVGNPASRSRETVNSFGSSGGLVDLPSPSSIYAPGLPHIPPGPFERPSRPVSGNASQISLDKSLASTAAAVAAAWEADSVKNGNAPSNSSNKRPFGRWWSRSKEAVNAAAEDDKPAAAPGPIERPSKTVKKSTTDED